MVDAQYCLRSCNCHFTRRNGSFSTLLLSLRLVQALACDRSRLRASVTRYSRTRSIRHGRGKEPPAALHSLASNITTTTHRLRSRHQSISPGTPRYCRNRISPLPDLVSVSVSTPLAGRRPRRRARNLRRIHTSPRRAARISNIVAIIGISSETLSQWRIEGKQASARGGAPHATCAVSQGRT